MKRIVIFASGNGSNAEAIWNSAKTLGYKVDCLISDREVAPVLQKAKNNGIDIFLIPKLTVEARELHEDRILSVLKDREFDLIVLAGYQRIFSSFFINQFSRNSIVNIHPSLLPDFPGQNAYQKAFNAHVDTAGCTIHFVDEGIDTGEIFEQHRFNNSYQTVEDFISRGLDLEHSVYPVAIQKILNKNEIHRFEILPKKVEYFSAQNPKVAKVYWIQTAGPCAKLAQVAKEILADEVVEDVYFRSSQSFADKLKHLGLDNHEVLEISFLPGVTDNTAGATREALQFHPHFKEKNIDVYSGKLLFCHSQQNPERYYNSWLESARWLSKKNDRFNSKYIPEVKLEPSTVKMFNLNISDDDLIQLSKKSLWALNVSELSFIRDHFKMIQRNPTDVEMEIIAQTWSEHCKHKIFAATIEHEDVDGKRKVNSLFKTFIKGATTRILEERKINWARSVFTDNAGIIRWDDKLDVCIKVETHNSPSALDPYGGALTGILGVNRDILGTGIGARPIANTNVFCLPPEDGDLDGLWPKELHSPIKMRDGVHKGVQDGGNKSGIPTVNGAFNYDLSFAGKPLVFCGTIGVLPHKINGVESHEKNQAPGDYIVMIGGKIGKDGIHGATFSSMELKDGTPSTVVQIGDPLTQKRMTDFLLKARDQSLYNSITDNGAGGLSSSIGEMAVVTNGATIDLSQAPLKYPGLSPYEIMISESQERMTCSVPPDKFSEFRTLAQEMGVEVSHLGTFTTDGFLRVYFRDKLVAELSLGFLHDDLPPMKLNSTWVENYPRHDWKSKANLPHPNTLRDKVLSVLNHPNVKSHETWVRQYDHEVLASSIKKPFTINGGPTDGAVIAMGPHGGGEKNGIVLSCGLAPKVSLQDTKLMAMYAVDEAIRNLVVSGANPDIVALVDNFCWPDPLPGENNPDSSQKLGELVRCNEGLYEIATTWGMPFVSGKDSMKNDAIVEIENKKIKISVLPTLLVTAIAKMEDISKVVLSSFFSGDDLWLLGNSDNLNPFTLNEVTGHTRGRWGKGNLESIIQNYREFYGANQMDYIGGAHDVSEGGILIALIEMAINSNLGFDLFLDQEEIIFGEGMGMIVFSSSMKNRVKIERHFKSVKLIGRVRSDQAVNINGNMVELKDCKKSYQGT